MLSRIDTALARAAARSGRLMAASARVLRAAGEGDVVQAAIQLLDQLARVVEDDPAAAAACLVPAAGVAQVAAVRLLALLQGAGEGGQRAAAADAATAARAPEALAGLAKLLNPRVFKALAELRLEVAHLEERSEGSGGGGGRGGGGGGGGGAAAEGADEDGEATRDMVEQLTSAAAAAAAVLAPHVDGQLLCGTPGLMPGLLWSLWWALGCGQPSAAASAVSALDIMTQRGGAEAWAALLRNSPAPLVTDVVERLGAAAAGEAAAQFAGALRRAHVEWQEEQDATAAAGAATEGQAAEAVAAAAAPPKKDEAAVALEGAGLPPRACAAYCSDACAKAAWRAGHRDECRELQAQRKAAAQPAAGAAAAGM
ncbi:MAG: hypothetical protein J3K34DRAFT_497387 [Monoraphidium minutum]|nr:MAG: hypothetical protein J3K34DRAFT_497387 [Monoraphidium minutum]